MPDAAYRAAIRWASPMPTGVAASSEFTVTLMVKNTSDHTWSSRNRSPGRRQPLARCGRSPDADAGRWEIAAAARGAARAGVAGDADYAGAEPTGHLRRAKSIWCTRASAGSGTRARRRCASRSTSRAAQRRRSARDRDDAGVSDSGLSGGGPPRAAVAAARTLHEADFPMYGVPRAQVMDIIRVTRRPAGVSRRGSPRRTRVGQLSLFRGRRLTVSRDTSEWARASLDSRDRACPRCCGRPPLAPRPVAPDDITTMSGAAACAVAGDSHGPSDSDQQWRAAASRDCRRHRIRLEVRAGACGTRGHARRARLRAGTRGQFARSPVSFRTALPPPHAAPDLIRGSLLRGHAATGVSSCWTGGTVMRTDIRHRREHSQSRARHHRRHRTFALDRSIRSRNHSSSGSI